MKREVVVYPSVDATDEFFEMLPLITGEFETYVRGRGYDLYRIREYMPEDSARHMDWKATAKSGSLKVREFTREDERKLCIVFDNPPAGLISDAAYERAVNLAASLAWHFSSQDAEVSFVIPGRGREVDLHRFLGQLATIEPLGGEPFWAAPRPGIRREDELREIGLDNWGEFNIVLTARPAGSLPTSWWNCSYFVFLGADGSSRFPKG
jgi:uncharacterized protein (DUF58 family)